MSSHHGSFHSLQTTAQLGSWGAGGGLVGVRASVSPCILFFAFALLLHVGNVYTKGLENSCTVTTVGLACWLAHYVGRP